METAVDKRSVETLALLIASKTGGDDNFALVARKVIADYIGAKRIIKEYNESAALAAKKPKEKKADADKKRRKGDKAARM
jgi:hypothetical protein